MHDTAHEPTALVDVPAGYEVEVQDFLGCRRRAQRLAELGMTPGTQLFIVRTSPGQPILLRVRGALLAIDRRSAREVIVLPCREPLAAGRGERTPGRRTPRFGLGRGRRQARSGRRR